VSTYADLVKKAEAAGMSHADALAAVDEYVAQVRAKKPAPKAEVAAAKAEKPAPAKPAPAPEKPAAKPTVTDLPDSVVTLPAASVPFGHGGARKYAEESEDADMLARNERRYSDVDRYWGVDTPEDAALRVGESATTVAGDDLIHPVRAFHHLTRVLTPPPPPEKQPWQAELDTAPKPADVAALYDEKPAPVAKDMDDPVTTARAKLKAAGYDPAAVDALPEDGAVRAAGKLPTAR